MKLIKYLFTGLITITCLTVYSIGHAVTPLSSEVATFLQSLASQQKIETQEIETIITRYVAIFEDIISAAQKATNFGTFFSKMQNVYGKELEELDQKFKNLKDQTPPNLWKAGSQGIANLTTSFQKKLIDVELSKLNISLDQLNQQLSDINNNQIIFPTPGQTVEAYEKTLKGFMTEFEISIKNIINLAMAISEPTTSQTQGKIHPSLYLNIPRALRSHSGLAADFLKSLSSKLRLTGLLIQTHFISPLLLFAENAALKQTEFITPATQAATFFVNAFSNAISSLIEGNLINPNDSNIKQTIALLNSMKQQLGKPQEFQGKLTQFQSQVIKDINQAIDNQNYAIAISKLDTIQPLLTDQHCEDEIERLRHAIFAHQLETLTELFQTLNIPALDIGNFERFQKIIFAPHLALNNETFKKIITTDTAFKSLVLVKRMQIAVATTLTALIKRMLFDEADTLKNQFIAKTYPRPWLLEDRLKLYRLQIEIEEFVNKINALGLLQSKDFTSLQNQLQNAKQIIDTLDKQ